MVIFKGKQRPSAPHCHILGSHGMIADRAISCDVTVYSLTAFQPLTEERILSPLRLVDKLHKQAN
jgi:hypothetical protein